jgi:NAD(P)-dependent dehydrogenase (short-subunit alcohol dehydrogenase family)
MTDALTAGFGARTTADEVLAGVDLRGKQVVLTGGSSGLGRETVRALAAAGAAVVFTSRDVAKGESAAKAIRDETGNPAIQCVMLDLTSLSQVSAFANTLRRDFPKLDMLILNAGGSVPTLERNAQGIESQFMTGYVGHLMIAAALAPALVAAAPSRIITLSSSGHKIAPLDFDDVNFQTRPYDGIISYSQSKTATSLLAVALNARLAARGVLAFAVHPGIILDTGLSRNEGDGVDADTQIEKYAVPRSIIKSIQQGAATTVWAATSPDLAASGGGKYLENCHISEPSELEDLYSGLYSYAVSPLDAERLWAVAEGLLGHAISVD